MLIKVKPEWDDVPANETIEQEGSLWITTEQLTQHGVHAKSLSTGRAYYWFVHEYETMEGVDA